MRRAAVRSAPRYTDATRCQWTATAVAPSGVDATCRTGGRVSGSGVSPSASASAARRPGRPTTEPIARATTTAAARRKCSAKAPQSRPAIRLIREVYPDTTAATSPAPHTPREAVRTSGSAALQCGSVAAVTLAHLADARCARDAARRCVRRGVRVVASPLLSRPVSISHSPDVGGSREGAFAVSEACARGFRRFRWADSAVQSHGVQTVGRTRTSRMGRDGVM